MILKESINNLVISGCSVSCKLFAWIFFGFFLGSMVIYLCRSPSILVSKSHGGGCRKLVKWWRLLWENRFHSQCSLSVVRVAM